MKIFPRHIFILLFLGFCYMHNLSARQNMYENDSLLVAKLKDFQLAMQTGSPSAQDYYGWVIDYIRSNEIRDSLILSDSYYYTGTYNYLNNNYDDAIELLNNAINYRSAIDRMDDVYARARTNMGLSYLRTGETEKARVNLEIALETREKLFGVDSPVLLRTLLNLSAVYANMHMHERSIAISQRGIRIAENVPDGSSNVNLLNLYFNSGVSFMNIQDFNRAERNFRLAYNLAQGSNVLDNERLLMLYNSLGACYYELDRDDMSEQYFIKALQLADEEDLTGSTVNLLYVNYALYLASAGDYNGAQEFYLTSLERSGNEFGQESREYAIQLLNYSYFLVYFLEDYTLAEKVLNEILHYVDKNPQDTRVAGEAYLYLARLMYSTGRNDSALYYINKNLISATGLSLQRLIASFSLKGKILFAEYRSDNDIHTLKQALLSVEEAINIVETSRLRIKEDESRSRIAGRYIDLYDLAMEILSELSKVSEDPSYDEKAFLLSERSKAASLLLETRNNRNLNFQLPAELSELEAKLLAEIRDYNEVIYNESARLNPDNEIIDYYQLQSVRSGARYDSLIKVFEKQYPRYYNLKHNTGVISSADIPQIIGKNGNFIEYYLSDSLLNIFMVNSEGFVFRSYRTDSAFKDTIIHYREILTDPSIISESTSQYNDFVNLAYELYKWLILPVKEYLVSDRLIISPDNLLSFIPFETLISEKPAYDELNYRELSYLLRKYDITYEYSATILSETSESRKSVSNSTLSFAPDYGGSIKVQDLMLSRQLYRDSLTTIEGAREEAIFINKLLGGKLFLDDNATESAFKDNIMVGDIVHLAMHTLLNDSEPMYSKMVFNMETDSIEDGLLNTFEVYNIPIRSKMVFLSSCNTGSGYLQSGEGVMSLARGFFYSGSPCVVMSLWEVDDHSGSDIVKGFYSNLKRGFSKSESLRKARIDYLEEADQMRSHPYFWSTLVIMGNDDPVYIPLRTYLLMALFVVIAYRIIRRIYESRSE